MYDLRQLHLQIGKWILRAVLVSLMLSGVTACVRSQPQIVVITSPPDASTGSTIVPDIFSTMTIRDIDLPSEPEQSLVYTTSDSTPSVNNVDTEYSVQSGDTLSGIAATHGVSIEMLLSLNTLVNPDVLTVGQIIQLPSSPNETTGNFKIIPDSRLIRAPGSNAFDIESFINQQPGYIHLAVDTVNDQLLTASQVVQRISLEYSVDSRLLLAILEFKAKWLSQLELDDIAKVYPMEGQSSPPGFDRSGLYKQLAWTANQLNTGYYGWKNRAWTTLEFEESVRLLYTPGLNAGTIGVQYFLSQNSNYLSWQQHVSQEGFYRTYSAYFGDPFANTLDSVIQVGLPDPVLTLPFRQGQTWFFTGGWHGGWGSGSAWSAIDFAPPDDRTDESALCYVSEYWATAMAAGVIARSGDGSVILDLDMDGDESTGWTILYLHMATDGRVAPGVIVQPGDLIGRPSCEGGFSTATHMHIARRYNGEWIPVSCPQCQIGFETPSFVLGGWTAYGLVDQEYQGYMMNGSEQRIAEQGRLTPINRISW